MLRIRFKGKIESEGAYAGAVRVPALTEAHVVTPRSEWSTRERLLMASAARTDTVRTVMRRAGLVAGPEPFASPRYLSAATPNIEFRPERGGMFATVQFSLEI